jgi:hypothetical protein
MAIKAVLRGGPFDGRELTIRTEKDEVEATRIGIGQSFTSAFTPITAVYVKTDEKVGDRTVFTAKKEETNE